jgi:uncharacterized protein YdhG (YjbR/CyaY superfamily)
MKMMGLKFKTIDAYIKACPKETREVLQTLRKTIHAVAPQAEEAMRYGLATFRLNGNLVHFGGYLTHIGFYPGASAVLAFKKELVQFDTSKGTVRFPLEVPLPLPLIRKIVKFRVTENLAKGKKK